MRLPVHRDSYAAACPDCPAGRLGVLRDLVDRHACAFDTSVIEARESLPAAWVERYAFGIVRRGVLIRQRLGPGGRATAVDAAGPGCFVPLDGDPAKTSHYAATSLLVCLCPTSTVEPSLGQDLLGLQRAALDRVERLAQARGAGTAREKVGALIVVLSETLSPPRTRDRLPSGLQQRDMAKLLGLRHETFCRALGGLEADGAIARSPDGLAILDAERLAS